MKKEKKKEPRHENRYPRGICGQRRHRSDCLRCPLTESLDTVSRKGLYQIVQLSMLVSTFRLYSCEDPFSQGVAQIIISTLPLSGRVQQATIDDIFSYFSRKYTLTLHANGLLNLHKMPSLFSEKKKLKKKLFQMSYDCLDPSRIRTHDIPPIGRVH